MLQETAWIDTDYHNDTFTIACHNIEPAIITAIVKAMGIAFGAVDLDGTDITINAECIDDNYTDWLDHEYKDGWGEEEWFNYFFFTINEFFEDNDIDLAYEMNEIELTEAEQAELLEK